MNTYKLGSVFLGIGVAGALLGASLIGYGIGKHDGKVQNKEDTVILLDMERYDAQQNAKFAGSSAQQREILYTAGSVNTVFEVLERNGYFDDLSPYFRDTAMPWRK